MPSIWLCDLRDVEDRDGFLRAVLDGIGAAPTAEDPALTIERTLAGRGGGVLVLDDADDIFDLPSLVRRWLDASKALRIVVTGREYVPFGHEGEQVLELAGMRLADRVAGVGEAIELFVERVRSARPQWSPDEQELAAIDEIVRRLCGVPLAIELAASRAAAARTESPRDPVAREVLRKILRTTSSSSSPSEPPSSSDVRAAARIVRQTWLLLDPWECEALAQASVFRGGFSLEAAAAVVVLEGPDAPVVSDVLLGLARKSLIEVHGWDPLRLAMAESVRSLASDSLGAGPQASAVRWRHAQWCYERARTIAEPPEGQPMPLVEAVRERENLQTALSFAASTKRHDLVLRLSIALDAITVGNGLTWTQMEWLDDALSSATTNDVGLVGRALGVRAASLFGMGRTVEAREDAESALGVADRLGDLRQVAAMHRLVGRACFQLGDNEKAREHFEEQLATERARGHRPGIASALQWLGSIHATIGDTNAGRMYYESSLALAVEVGDGYVETRAAMSLACLWLELAELTKARALFVRARSIAQRLRLSREHRIITGYIGLLDFEGENLGDAELHLRVAAEASRREGDLRNQAMFEGIRGAVLAALGRREDSATMFDFALRLLRDNPYFRGIVAIHRGHLDVAEAYVALAREDLDAARAHALAGRMRIEDATLAPGSSQPPLVKKSDDARIAVRILARAVLKLEKAIAIQETH